MVKLVLASAGLADDVGANRTRTELDAEREQRYRQRRDASNPSHKATLGLLTAAVKVPVLTQGQPRLRSPDRS